ncbi:hypothetical protein ATANTOWER_022889, partial [Ataeniobius toweri]|nr:hypothetical protein [Ataeniobius toweri]
VSEAVCRPPKTPTLLRFNIFSLQSAEETSFKDVSVLCSYKSRLPVMQSEEGFWFQSLQFQGLSETDWWLQVVLHEGGKRFFDGG